MGKPLRKFNIDWKEELKRSPLGKEGDVNVCVCVCAQWYGVLSLGRAPALCRTHSKPKEGLRRCTIWTTLPHAVSVLPYGRKDMRMNDMSAKRNYNTQTSTWLGDLKQNVRVKWLVFSRLFHPKHHRLTTEAEPRPANCQVDNVITYCFLHYFYSTGKVKVSLLWWQVYFICELFQPKSQPIRWL